MIGDVPALEATDYSGDNGSCSPWSVVTGFSNGSATALTTQQHVSVSTQVRVTAHWKCATEAFLGLGWDVFLLVFLFLTQLLSCRSFADVLSCHRKKVPDGKQSLPLTASLGCASVQVDGGFLSPGTAYHVRVSAINAAGASEDQEAEVQDNCGDVVDACTPRAPPPPPVDAKVPT